MNNKVVQLRRLDTGDMFRREGSESNYRYVKSCHKGGKYGDEIYCFNLDGESVGYFHPKDEKVVKMHPPQETEVPKEIPEPEPTVFYMCYVVGSGAPAVMQDNYGIARSEAERLARVSGNTVFLLKAISWVKYTPPSDSWYVWAGVQE